MVTVKGHLLVFLPFPEPENLIERLKAKYPHLKVTYITSKLAVDWQKASGLPDEKWADVDYLCSMNEFPPDPSKASNLKLVHIATAGTNHVWSRPIYTSSTVPLTTSSGIHGAAIGEWAIMASLVASHKYNSIYERQIRESWSEDGGGKATFSDVRTAVGQRLGVLGYGSIGRHAARVAKAMGMDVIAYTVSPRDTPESRQDDSFVEPGTGDPDGSVPSAWFHGGDEESLHRFLGQDLDQLLVSVPLTPKTEGLLGKKEFEVLAKRNAFVMNISRGEVLDQEALIDALRDFEEGKADAEGRKKGLRGAALDVATPEPLPAGHPLWKAPNCIISPHISGLATGYADRVFQILEINLERYAKGEKLMNLVNRESGYASKA